VGRSEKKTGKPLDGILILIATVWVVEGINFFTGHQLCRWGIFPRTITGLVGIPLSPFLHGSIVHLLANTVPLAILGGLTGLHGRLKFLETTVIIILVGGGGVWILGRPSYHVGASGLIFGYFGFLVLRGYYKKSIGSFLVSIITLFIYGGLLWGLLPTIPHVSWEGHLCGLVGGIVAAKLSTSEA
jgi:membrane associated rhomboid family serine protease